MRAEFDLAEADSLDHSLEKDAGVRQKTSLVASAKNETSTTSADQLLAVLKPLSDFDIT